MPCRASQGFKGVRGRKGREKPFSQRVQKGAKGFKRVQKKGSKGFKGVVRDQPREREVRSHAAFTGVKRGSGVRDEYRGRK